MLQSLGLGFIFKAKDEASETIEKVHEHLHELKEAGEHAHHSVLGALGMSGKAVAGIGLALAGAGAAAAFEFAEKADDFSHAIREAGVAAHASAEQLEEFEHMAKTHALNELEGSAVETAQVLAELTKEGYNLDESGQALDGTLNLIRMSMGRLTAADAAGLVNDTLGEFGMRADKAGELADKLAFAMQRFGFRAEELRGTMSGLASGAQVTHSSLDDVLIGVGLIKQVFPSATKAASSMNVALQQLASTHTQKELAGIGVAVKDAHGKMLPLLDVMKQLSDKTSRMTEAQLSNRLATIGSARAAGGLITIIDALKKGVVDNSGHLLTGGAALEFYRKQISDTSGTAKRMSDLLGDDMAGALKHLRGAISNAAVALGGAFEGGFKNAIQNLNLLIRGLTQLFTQGGFSGDVKDALDKHLGIKDFAIGVFLWVKRIQNFLSNLSDSFSAAFEPVKPALDELIQAFGFLGNELGLTSQTAGDNASKFDSFGQAGANVGRVLAELAGAVIPALKFAVLFVAGAVDVAKAAWDSFGGVIGSVWGIISGVVRMIGGLLTGNWSMLWNGFVDVVKNAALGIVNVLMGIVGFVAKAVDGIGGIFGKSWDHVGRIEDLKKEWAGNINFVANDVKSVQQGGPLAAHAAQEGQAKASAAAFAEMMPAAGEGPAAEQHVHSHVTLNVDGEKLAEAHANAKRSAHARSFHAVPVEGGSY